MNKNTILFYKIFGLPSDIKDKLLPKQKTHSLHAPAIFFSKIRFDASSYEISTPDNLSPFEKATVINLFLNLLKLLNNEVLLLFVINLAFSIFSSTFMGYFSKSLLKNS